MKIVSSVCLLGLVSTVACAGIAVVPPRDATPQARLAAKEIARYVYLRTGELPAAAAELFEHDAYGPKPQIGYCPWPAAAADCNTVFNQTAAMYREAFALRVADSRKAFPSDLPKQSLFSRSVSQRFGILSE